MNNESFLGMLAESPFAGLQEHMKAGDEAVTKLGDFLTAILLIILKTIFVIIFPNHFLCQSQERICSVWL